jgi:hypothetical protein
MFINGKYLQAEIFAYFLGKKGYQIEADAQVVAASTDFQSAASTFWVPRAELESYLGPYIPRRLTSMEFQQMSEEEFIIRTDKNPSSSRLRISGRRAACYVRRR